MIISKILNLQKYVKYVAHLPKTIEWKEWQFKDIIFKNSTILDTNTKINFTVKGKYVLYLLCQYSDGHLRWLNFNNQNISENNEIETTKSIREINIPIVRLMKYDFGAKSKKNLIPSQVVGLRIRANVEGNLAKIDNLYFYDE